MSSGASGGTVVLLSHIGLYLLGEIINKLLFQPCDSGPGQQAAGGIVEIVRAAPHYRSRGGAVMIFVTDSRRRADLSCLMCPIDNSFLGGLYHLRREGSVAQNVAETDFNLSKLSPCMLPHSGITSHSAVVCVVRVISAKLTFKQYKSAKIEFHNILAFPHFQTDTLTDRIKCADNKNKIVIFMWRFVADRANTAGHCKIL